MQHTPTIGVVAVQGGFAAHVAALENLGASVRLVKTPDALDELDGIVLPGGESSTQLKLYRETGLLEAVQGFVQAGGAVFGTCAGLILLSSVVRDPAQESLGLMDVDVSRNAWGRQVHSFEADSDERWRDGERTPLMFIRAPRITRVGKGVEIAQTYQGEAILVVQGNRWAATYHPELTADFSVMRDWLSLAVFSKQSAAG